MLSELTTQQQNEYKHLRSKIITMIDRLEELESIHHLQGNKADEATARATSNFLIELLVKIPEVKTLSDAFMLTQAVHLSIHMVNIQYASH